MRFVKFNDNLLIQKGMVRYVCYLGTETCNRPKTRNVPQACQHTMRLKSVLMLLLVPRSSPLSSSRGNIVASCNEAALPAPALRVWRGCRKAATACSCSHESSLRHFCRCYRGTKPDGKPQKQTSVTYGVSALSY